VANYNIDIGVVIKGNEKLTKFNNALKKTTLQVEQLNKFLKVFQQSGDGLVRSFDTVNSVLVTAKANFNAVASGTKLQEKAARQLIVAEKQLNKEYRERNTLLQRLRGTGAMNLPGTGVGRDPVASSIERRRKKLMRGANKNSPHSRPIGPGQVSDANLRSPLPPRSDVVLSSVLPPRVPLPPRSSLDPGQSLFGQSVGGASSRSRQILAENQALQEALGSMNSRAFGRFKFMPPIQGTTESQLKLKTRVSSNVAESQRIREIVAAGSSRANLGGGFKEFNKNAKKIQGDTKKISTIVAQNQAQGIQAFGNQQFAQPIGPVRPGPLGRLGIGTGANPKGVFANSKGKSGRISSGLQSGLIGGGFPLLFGQGGAGAIAGGLGGALGGALSPGFGFAGSIVATAVTQELQKIVQFRKQVSDLNIEMRSMGISANIGSTQINKLGKSLGITKEEAIKVLEQFKRFGEASVGLAKFFGGDFALFSGFAQADDVSSTLNAIQQASKDLTIQDQIRVTNLLNQKGAEAAINELIDMRKNKVIKLKEEEQKVRQFDPLDPTGKSQDISQIIRNQKELDKLNVESDESIQKLFEIKEGFTNLKFATEEAGFSVASEVERINKELRKLNNTQFQTVELSKTIGSSFQESFKGIIKGTMSVGDAFRNMFMRIADHFLDMAAQMAAAQIQKGFLSMFGNLLNPFSFGSSFASFGSVGAGTSNMFVGSASASAFLADGGTARSGRSYIVGERGPEMFTPGVTGTVTPNESLGGSTNIVVNVDASGSSVEGDEDQGRELGRLISVAVQSELVQQKRPGGLLA